MVVYGVVCLFGKKIEEVLLVLSIFCFVVGCFDLLCLFKGYIVIVDYVYILDVLENVLNVIYEVLNGKGYVIMVVGVGGNCDKGKCFLMV